MSKKKYETYLSTKDEYVPDKYIPIAELFSNPKYSLPGYSAEEWVMGYKTLDQLRSKTYREVKKRFKLSGLPSYSSFWNGNLDVINDLGLNEFAKLSCFSKLATAMICFETIIENKYSEGKRKYVSFGIRRDIYKRYSDSLRRALKTGSSPKPVSLCDSHKRARNDMFCKTTINFETPDGGHHCVKMDKNELFAEFEAWCRLKRVKRKTALYQAIELFLKENPADGLEKYKFYKKENEFQNREVVLSLVDEDYNAKSKLPKNIANQMLSIIKRYNDDPQNNKKEVLTESVYIAQAVMAYNKRVPLKYSDPIAYKEYLEIQESKRYNESILNKRK